MVAACKGSVRVRPRGSIFQGRDVIVSISACDADCAGANPVALTILNRLHLDCYNKCDYVGIMTLELKLRKVGNSVGVVLPKEALARLNVEEGDAAYLTATTDCGIRVRVCKPELAQRM